LLWVLVYKRFEGNEIADQLARRGLLYLFVWLEPACSISERVTKWAKCVCKDHRKYWQSTVGRRHT
jgi:hypothetical protein